MSNPATDQSLISLPLLETWSWTERITKLAKLKSPVAPSWRRNGSRASAKTGHLFAHHADQFSEGTLPTGQHFRDLAGGEVALPDALDESRILLNSLLWN
jgi:hypothetical protein